MRRSLGAPQVGAQGTAVQSSCACPQGSQACTCAELSGASSMVDHVPLLLAVGGLADRCSPCMRPA